MVLVLNTNVGFVATAPTTDPMGGEITINSNFLR